METIMSPNTTPSKRRDRNRERIKLCSQISLLNTTIEGKIQTLLKIENCPQVDDSSLALLSLPDGPIVSADTPIDHSFHSFVITSQNGQRIYGGSYVFGYKHVIASDGDHSVVYLSRALVALTVRPVVDQLKKLLEWCVTSADCNPRWIRCLAHIRLPAKGKCLSIHLPILRKSLSQKRSQDLNDSQLENRSTDENASDENPNNNINTINENQITIFRPLSALPLFDYPLRRLFTEILSPEQFLIAYCCALSETQILITSSSYYNLMLVSESLTTLLNPFKWQHVYVPILPTKLGLHYLDAPTPYIMGINMNSNSTLAINNLMIACLIDCDSNHVELSNDSSLLVMPPFYDSLRQELEIILNSDLRLSSSPVMQKSAALKRVTEIAKKHKVFKDSFNYLDDLKLNQTIRILFLKTIRKNILHKYQQFIISSNNRKETIRFDAVSYLSDQPQSIQPFLQHFVETQMFVSFIDETAKHLNKKHKTITSSEPSLYESIYDDDYDELDLSLFSDTILESRFKSAQEIDLEELEEIPTLSQANSISSANLAADIMSSPRTRRKFSQFSHKSLAKDLTTSTTSVLSSPSKTVPAALTAQTNWRVVETLMREVKIKTKRILLEKMGSDEVGPLGCGSVGGVEENTLIASLCELIERIWSHARSEDNKDINRWQSGKCSFWSHLMAYYQMESNDGINSNSQKAFDSSLLTPALSQISLDSSTSQSMPSSPSRQPNSNPMKQLPTTLIYDIRSIRSMIDIKTDVGKSRAFIRLALERKLLSKHLRTLLINQELLLNLYKRYAFLRCEEEREQFLTHLLTLNAVDLMCFTNTFTTSVLPYTLFQYGSSQMSGWFSISGSIASTSEIQLTNSINSYSFTHRNLGNLNTLTICVNQSSKVFIEYCFVRNEVTNHIYKFYCNRWFGRNIDDGSTERVLIGELMIGSIGDVIKKSNQTRSSSIGRNWTRNSDQYSKEESFTAEDLQTLLGESVNQIMKYYFNAQNNSNIITNNLNGDEMIDSKASKLMNISNASYNSRSSISATLSQVGKRSSNRNTSHSGKNLIQLIFGERKLLWVLTQIFYFGFKNRGRSSFRKQNYLWDYLLRLQCELKISHRVRNGINASDGGEDFVDIIDSITNNASNYGKDSKFRLFLLISIRDHKLTPNFLKLLTRPSISHLFYENESFVRDLTLKTFLLQILNTFNDIELTFESSLTKGL